MLRMTRFLAVLLGVASFAASGLVFAAVGYIYEFQGTVTAALGTGQPVPAQKNMNLESNTTVATGARSFAVIKFEDGTVVVLKENTSFQIQHYVYNAKSPSQSSALFNMVRGGLRMITGVVSAKNRDALKVATPIATIGIRGTEFLAELVNPLLVQVISGSVSLTNAAGVTIVNAGQTATVASANSRGIVAAAGTVPGPQIPNVPTPAPVPGPIPAGPVVGAGGIGAGVAVGIAAGIAAAAAVFGGSSDNPPPAATTHH